MILICYDGSADAKAAIEHGARVLKEDSAAVLTVWQPFFEVLAHTATFGVGAAMLDTEKIDAENRKHADKLARGGARLARDAGLEAEARVVEQTTTTSEAILSEADALHASAILLGSRGLTGLKSLLIGSVSHGVVQRADRTVIVVPSPEIASARERERSIRSE
jgi:nucleotide-binding universal stress UspA family protein